MSLPVTRTSVCAAFAATFFSVSILAQCPGGYGPPPPPPPPGGSYGGPNDSTGTPTTGGPSGPAPSSPSGPSPARPTTPGAPAPAGPVTGGRGGPAAPAPSGPSTGGARGPASGLPAIPGRAARTGPRGAPLGEDLTTWQQWWDFNQDGFLRLRDREGEAATGTSAFYLGSSRRTAAPAAADRPLVVDKVLPTLKRAVDNGPRNVTSAGMLALARIGVDHPDFRLFDVFVERLDDGDQTTRETAAVAIGLAGHTDPRSVDQLTGLLRDDSFGRRAAGGEVEDRTRSFAAYGLGLLAHRSDAVRTKRRAFEALRDVLLDDDVRSRDVHVATLQAIGLLDIDQSSYDGMKLASEVLTCLDEYFTDDRGAGEQNVQAHCPTAIARLLGRDHERADRYKQRFAAVLEGRSFDGKKRRRYGHAVAQSCALALGQLVKPNESGDAKADPDVRYSELLLDTWHDHKDAQTRNFAMLALGQIGGAANRDALLREFRRASTNIEQPWCALALGLCSASRFERTGDVDAMVVETLEKQFLRGKNPQAVGALAIGLGLCHEAGAGEKVLERLNDAVGREQMAEAMCESLALLGTVGAREALYEVVRESDRRPQLLQKAATALGRLGDPLIGDMLVRRLSDHEANYAMQQAISAALIDVGGQQQIEPLLAVIDDQSRSAAVRASAAKALGGIVDMRVLPWNTPLRANANYRANVATLTDRSAGVLDLR